MQKNKVVVGILISFCVIFAVLITSVEAVCYWTPGYFEAEYEKHDVLSRLPEMSMSSEDGLMAVTHHMMKYLRGDADAPELQIEVTMGGERRGFFTEREILHMEDVRNLFVGAQKLRIYAIVLAVFLTALLWGLCRREEHRRKGRMEPAVSAGGSSADGVQGGTAAGQDSGKRRKGLREFWKALALGFLLGTGLILLTSALFGAYIGTHFSTAFVTFHHIFFDNDLWILDPSVDMLVNIVPEGFFFDTAFRILGLFLGSIALLCVASGAYLFRARKKIFIK